MFEKRNLSKIAQDRERKRSGDGRMFKRMDSCLGTFWSRKRKDPTIAGKF